eukprot:768268-Hanusia_phi.AAC.1
MVYSDDRGLPSNTPLKREATDIYTPRGLWRNKENFLRVKGVGFFERHMLGSGTMPCNGSQGFFSGWGGTFATNMTK